MTKSDPSHYTNYGYTNYEFHKTLEAVKNIVYVSKYPNFSSGNIQNSLFASNRDIAIFRSEIRSQPQKLSFLINPLIVSATDSVR